MIAALGTLLVATGAVVLLIAAWGVIVLPDALARDFGISHAAVGGLITATQLGCGLALLLVGSTVLEWSRLYRFEAGEPHAYDYAVDFQRDFSAEAQELYRIGGWQSVALGSAARTTVPPARNTPSDPGELMA